MATFKRHIFSDQVWGDDVRVIWKAATTGGQSRYLLVRCVAVTLSAPRLHRLVLPVTVHASGRSVWEPRVHVTVSGSWGRGFEKNKINTINAARANRDNIVLQNKSRACAKLVKVKFLDSALFGASLQNYFGCALWGFTLRFHFVTFFKCCTQFIKRYLLIIYIYKIQSQFRLIVILFSF